MAVVISPNIKKESVRLDGNGNQIDPKSKQIIKEAEKPYIPTPEEVAVLGKPEPIKEVKFNLDTLGDIKNAIKQQEVILEDLKQRKQQKVEEMKKELEDV